MITTSNFARHKTKPNGIGIALSPPFWYQGPSYPPLFPSWDMIVRYKSDIENSQITNAIETYIYSYYNEVLSKLDPYRVYADLRGKTALCYEKRGEFCHRRVFADWMWETTGNVIFEI